MEETTSLPTNFSSCDFPESYNGQFFVDTGISLLLVIIAMVNNGIVIFTSVYNKNSMRQMKYLNRIVASLAISDFLFGSIGIPLSITYYYLSYTGQANLIVSRNERWQLDAIWFVPLVIHGLHSAQLVFIAGTYTVTLLIISNQSSIYGQHEDHEKTHFTKMVSAIILCMFVCYLPYIIEWHIDVTMVPVKESCEINQGDVIFSTLSRHLLQLHSCLNPIIYATTVPAFKEKIKYFVCCRFRHSKDMNQSDDTYPDGCTRESSRY